MRSIGYHINYWLLATFTLQRLTDKGHFGHVVLHQPTRWADGKAVVPITAVVAFKLVFTCVFSRG